MEILAAELSDEIGSVTVAYELAFEAGVVRSDYMLNTVICKKGSLAPR